MNENTDNSYSNNAIEIKETDSVTNNRNKENNDINFSVLPLLDLHIISSIFNKINPRDLEGLVKNTLNTNIFKIYINLKLNKKLRLITGLENGTIAFWDVNTKSNYKNITDHHTKSVRSLLQFDENTLITASFDSKIIIWDLNTFEKIRELTGHNDFIRCLLKIDDETFATGSNDHTIKIWSINQDKELRTILGSTCFVLTLIKIESNLWVSGTGDGNIIFWDLLNKDSPLFILEGHKLSTWCLEKLHDSNLLASGSGDSTIRIWDINKRKCKKILNTGNTNITGISNMNKKMIASFSSDGMIRFWNYYKGEIVKKICAFEKSMIVCSSKLIYDRFIFTGGSNSIIKMWDFKNEEGKYYIKSFNNNFAIRSLMLIED